MHLNVAIVDDLREDRAMLAIMVQRWFDLQKEHSVDLSFYERAEDLLEAGIEPQLVFLDICMEGMNGLELARRLRSYDEKLLIVFLSTSREFAFEAFPIHPFDYLVKPCSSEALDRVLREALRVLDTKEPGIDVRVPRAVHHVALRRIVAAVSQGHNVEIRLLGGDLLRSNMTFSEVEALLKPDPRFLLCSRGVIANMDLALSLSGDKLSMQDGSVFYLRSRGRAELTARFNQYQLSRLKGGRT